MPDVLEPVILRTGCAVDLDDDALYELCRINPELRIERASSGDLIFMAPEGGSSGRGNARLVAIFDTWAEQDGTGQVFGPSTGFILPNGAMRSPDIAWVRNLRLDALTETEFERFPPLCPQFVLELRSPSDSISVLKEKMCEYIANGALLGWLIDPITRQVHIYSSDAPPRVLDEPVELSGEPILRGFRLNLPSLWKAMSRS